MAKRPIPRLEAISGAIAPSKRGHRTANGCLNDVVELSVSGMGRIAGDRAPWGCSPEAISVCPKPDDAQSLRICRPSSSTWSRNRHWRACEGPTVAACRGMSLPMVR